MSERNIEVREVTLKQAEVTDEMSDWQPIESAPFETDSATDEKWLAWCLLFVPDDYGGVVLVGGMSGGYWLHRDDRRRCSELENPPTHWMLLPKKPA